MNEKHPALTNAEFMELAKYVRALADKMELRDWTINLAFDPPEDEDHAACVEGVYGRKWADLSVSLATRERKPEELRQTIVHELVHLHFIVCWQMVRVDLLEHLGQSAYNLFCDSYKRAQEYGVEALAEVIAPQMPLIRWPAARKTKSG